MPRRTHAFTLTNMYDSDSDSDSECNANVFGFEGKPRIENQIFIRN